MMNTLNIISSSDTWAVLSLSVGGGEDPSSGGDGDDGGSGGDETEVG
jgi:hypothetical protein